MKSYHFNYGNTTFQTRSFFKQWLKWQGLWKLLFCKSWAPTTIFQLFISHTLALVSNFPVPSVIIIMQNSFQNIGYVNMVNQSIFIGEVMYAIRLSNFCPLKNNLILQTWFKNMVWLLTAELSKCLALLVFCSVNSKCCSSYSSCIYWDFIYSLKLYLSKMHWTLLGCKAWSWCSKLSINIAIQMASRCLLEV